jgi:hypothetical protein
LPQLFRERKKLVKNFASDEVVIEPDPFMREEMEKAIRVMARDIEVIDLLKKYSPARARFSRDHCKKAAYGSWLRVIASVRFPSFSIGGLRRGLVRVRYNSTSRDIL